MSPQWLLGRCVHLEPQQPPVNFREAVRPSIVQGLWAQGLAWGQPPHPQKQRLEEQHQMRTNTHTRTHAHWACSGSPNNGVQVAWKHESRLKIKGNGMARAHLQEQWEKWHPLPSHCSDWFTNWLTCVMCYSMNQSMPCILLVIMYNSQHQPTHTCGTLSGSPQIAIWLGILMGILLINLHSVHLGIKYSYEYMF